MLQDLSLSILDLAQNGVAAGATLLTVTVEEDPDDDRLTITVEDNGRGMTPAEATRVTDPFYTTRTTRPVGFGVPFFQMAAELSGGTVSIHSTPGVGTAIVGRFVPSHLDCPPLGDLNATVLAFILGSPHLDLWFVRRLGKREMSLDTRVLRQVLGEIPLDTPEVSAFITDYLAENTRELLGENPSCPGPADATSNQ